MIAKLVGLAALLVVCQSSHLSYGNYRSYLPQDPVLRRVVVNAPQPIVQIAPRPVPIVRTLPQVLAPPPVVKKISEIPIIEPVTKTIVKPGSTEYDFGHTVSDPYANNHQSRQESRRGDVVEGSYSYLDALGTKRTVDYIATPESGFQATQHIEENAVVPVLATLPASIPEPVAPVAVPVEEPLPVLPEVVPSLPYSEPIVEPAPIITKVAEVPIVAPVTQTIVKPAVAEYDFGHTLSDPYSNNHQSRQESRRGDVVEGSYSYLDANGLKRTVDYIATPQDGFKANERLEEVEIAPNVETLSVSLPFEHAVPVLPNNW